jgi:hypothetical protein
MATNITEISHGTLQQYTTAVKGLIGRPQSITARRTAENIATELERVKHEEFRTRRNPP